MPPIMTVITRLLPAAALLVAWAALAGGCARNEPAPSPQAQYMDHPAATPQADPGATDRQAVADRLEMLARSVAGVRDANCVVFGNIAIVGIDVDGNLDRSRVGTIKYAVAEAFRKDPVGINAVVTADLDIAQRLREIRDDIRRGRPVAGFAEELADMVGRLVPQWPGDVVPREAPDRAQRDDAGEGGNASNAGPSRS